MSGKICPACSGIGSYFGTEWVRDDSVLSMYKRVTSRKVCEFCDGSGVPNGIPFRGRRNEVVPWEIRAVADDGGADATLRRLIHACLALAFFGCVMFQLFRQDLGMPAWLKVAVSLAACWLFRIALEKIAGTRRWFRRLALLAVVAMICFGFAFEFGPR